MFQGGLPPPSTTAGRVEHDDTSAIWGQVLRDMGYNPYNLRSEFYLSPEHYDQGYLDDLNRPATDEEMDRIMQGIDDTDLVAVCDKINSRHEQQRKLDDMAGWVSAVINDSEVDDSLESIDFESNSVDELKEVGVGEAFDE